VSQNLKQILIFIAVFISLLIVGFNSYKYWNKADAELELTREQNKRDLENDSLKMANAFVIQERDRLASVITNNETVKQGNYKTYKEKSKADTQKPASEQGAILRELINE